jgi:hypothetical protein
MDDFETGPLDISALTGGAAPPQAPAAPKKKGFDPTKLLLPVLTAVASRGGPMAVSALMEGMRTAREKKAAATRQGQLDQRAQSQQDWQRQYQQQQLANQASDDQRAFLGQFTTGLNALDDEAAVDAYMGLYRPQAQRYGLTPEALDAYVQQALPPSRVQKRLAEKRIAKLRADFGTKWMEEGAKFTHDIGGEQVPFQELLRRAGMTTDPAAPVVPSSVIKDDVPLDRQHAAAVAAGDTKTAKLILDAMTAQDSAKSQPVDPQLADLNRQIASMRLENMRAAKDTSGLPPRIQRQVDAQARGFDSQTITKRVQTMAEAVSFANSLDPKTTNPADDQALIYAFAKAMDPDSVVREGEYATVQKYAQSWAQTYGFNVARIFSNSPFLTPQARANMKATIQARYAPARAQYDNVRRSYADRINRMTGQPDGESYLIDYAGAFPGVPSGSGAGAGPVVTPGTGTRTAPGPNPFRMPHGD